ncbi:cilia- and flagella-associated protein 107 [Pristis pectinata]|uniref:cilia- and flagella-associated protein 107 n=1 Tax=Pristis pectinata TaxID=685728 RepID=UPI00223CC77D|nr:cilia- and flagella-associated protein 107 [Pristis pectinata]
MTDPATCPRTLEDRFAPDPLLTAPSWRIQQRYQNKVLVGNWAEERLKFIKGTCFGTTTYRADYKPYPFVSPDIKEKILIQQKHKGVPLSVLFSHHDIPRSWYLVSHYDEVFNRRPNPCLPPLREWDKRKLVWLPERTDHPLIAPPTNFGLLEEKIAKLNKRRQHHYTMYQTIYNISYGPDSITPQKPVSSQQ